MGIVPFFRFVLNVRNIDRNTAGFLFRGIVNLVICLILRSALQRAPLGDRRGQGRLTMIDVSHRSNIQMGLASVKLLLCHKIGLSFRKIPGS
jgi:hypothetical protein